jgi:predicted DCC family thiol-disulfide oxidoreductase YuxK
MHEKKISIYYQQSCGFCELCRHFIEKRVERTHVIFLDITCFMEQEGQEAPTDSIVVIDKGEQYVKYEACLVIAKHLRKPWPYVGSALRIIPNSIGDWGYGFVAHHRGFFMKIARMIVHKSVI